MALVACSGLDVTADGTDAFAATQYSRYAWRSEPPSQPRFSKDMTTRKSPSIRAGVEEKMSELGYQRVDKASAQFLLEYFAMPGFNDGQLVSGGSNEELYGSSVNRQIDGAALDNAYALSGPVEIGKIKLVFFDARTADVLWRVQVSMVVEDSNRIDHDKVREAMREAIAKLPPAS
ncbi:hypothetical protein HRUBRA_00261 [Pseudohaliea rubra DSM 19751]|uniref:DUF4136 domain-containing protein n=1 Tax=Pseudohaliea rubra DSM 19751 TaxID=1265313 RepID=A0A095X2H5_9GAMM|nr:hypothetical protein HRUBRA_00261 [Pseudohaliea rubra DSM 19751]